MRWPSRAVTGSKHRRARFLYLAWALGGALLGVGCGPGRGYERYVPPPESARQTLEAALTAWQEGNPSGPVPGAAPAITVVDSHRRPGQRLQRYEVLGEVARGGPRRFAVRLVLDQPHEEVKARFVVLGIDPLWVFREEDYDMLTHWECAMPTAKESEPSTLAPR